MDTREDGTKEFSNNKVIGASVLAPVDPDDRVKSANSSKPKTQRVAKRAKLVAKKTSGQEKLGCRYCGSDDLALSFKKRRDARCRACFKKRYSSPAPRKNTKKTCSRTAWAGMLASA
jgi:hypothetical protein